jgi:mono/diheme cytochrome c family protein
MLRAQIFPSTTLAGNVLVGLLLALLLALPQSVNGEELTPELAKWGERYEKEILPIIKSRCIECHSGDKPEGEFDLAKFASGADAAKAGDTWDRVARRVRQNEMPPPGSPGLNDPQKGAFHRWVDSRPNQDLCRQLASDETQSWYRGHVMSRRLTSTEYQNAVRDAVGIPLRPDEVPPSDGAGGEGFDTVGDALFTSAIHLETYLIAADRVIETALPEQTAGATPEVLAARQKLLVALPKSLDANSSLDERAAAEQIIATFARRAWRRPVTEEDVARLLAIYDGTKAKREGVSFLTAVKEPLKAVLISPHFLFVVESEPSGGGVQRITPHQLATRLALFVWSSIPDDELLRKADTGELYENDILRAEVRRMLRDPKAAALGENFGLQWLGLREFGKGTRPDGEVFPDFNNQLATDMREEAIRTVAGVFRDDAPLLNLLTADYIYANGRLAKHYGLELAADADWQRVPLSSRERGGVITMASVLTSASYPRRTSPVLRGRWILEEVLGSRVPPPPPNVPALEEEHGDNKPLTLRQRLEVHRQKAECASCHNRMDPLGFGLENFDGIGRWRTDDNGQPIDAAGKLPSGDTFSGPEELKSVLLKQNGEFQKHFVKKLLGFALGRPLNKFDDCVVDECLKQLKNNDLRASVLIEEIALSYPFQHRYFKPAK